MEPLSADAVAHAISPDAFTYARNNEVVDVALTLVGCQGLAVLDSELGLLRAIHFTAQAFLKDRFPEDGSPVHIAINSLGRVSDPLTLRRPEREHLKGPIQSMISRSIRFSTGQFIHFRVKKAV